MNISSYYGLSSSSLWDTSSSSNSSSSLFSTTSSSSSGNILGDFAAIKNGSYKKLLKSYYSQKNSSGSSDSELTSTENKQVTSMASDMSSLKKAADALKTTGKNSLFNEGENGVDVDKIYEATKTLVDAYNSAIDSTSNISIPVVDRKVELTQSMISKNSSMLDKIGISQKDGKLSIDESKFKSASVSDLKTMLNGNGSLSDKLSTRANSIYSVTQALLGNKINTYNSSALLNTGTSTGNIMDTLL